MHLTEIIREVRKLARDNPDFVYDTPYDYCFYVPVGDYPACIFGQAIHNLDPDFDLDRYNPNENIDSNISSVIRDNFEFTEEQLIWCRKVQMYQDYKSKWSDCIDIADKETPISLGYANSWQENPVELDQHNKFCSGKMVRENLATCLNKYHCKECGIIYKVDSSG